MKRTLTTIEAYQPVPLENVPPVTRLAFAEDALAIASWAESCGFVEDAKAMREFSAKVRPVFGANRWAQTEHIPAMTTMRERGAGVSEARVYRSALASRKAEVSA